MHRLMNGSKQLIFLRDKGDQEKEKVFRETCTCPAKFEGTWRKWSWYNRSCRQIGFPDEASEVDTLTAHCDFYTPAVATMPPRILPVVSPSPREHESAVSPSSLFVTMRGPRRLGGSEPKLRNSHAGDIHDHGGDLLQHRVDQADRVREGAAGAQPVRPCCLQR